MPFETFMAACLYDRDHGFFATGPLRSIKSGDFLTSPEVSPWFGRTLARLIADRMSRLPDDPWLVEVGAGSGSLLRSMLPALGSRAGHVVAVEASPAARSALAGQQDLSKVASSMDELGSGLSGVVVANELLDNFPVALVVRNGAGWEERWVGADAGGLTLVAAPVRDDVAAWADAYGGSVPEGGMVEVQLAANAWLEDAIRRLDSGTVIVIDYGGTTEELEPRRTLGTLRTYRNHHLGPDPLTEPGQTDVTVDVNFSALAAIAVRAGASATISRQDDMLEEWGLREEISNLRLRELELARAGDAVGRLVLKAEIMDADTLLHPRGLGDFRVLVADIGEAS
jgi:SAM-dependent MidA family methyltransferase